MERVNLTSHCLFLILIMSSFSCFHGVDLVEEGTVSIDIKPNRGIHISSASAIQNGDELRLSGWVKRPKSYSGFSNGHVHVSIIDIDGEVIVDKAIKYIPNRITPRGSRSSTFHEQFILEPKAGTTIKLRRHNLACTK